MRLLTALTAVVALTQAAFADEPPATLLDDWRPPTEVAATPLKLESADRWLERDQAPAFVVRDGRFGETEAEPYMLIEDWPSGFARKVPLNQHPVMDSLADAQLRPRYDVDIREASVALTAISVVRSIASTYEDECERMGGALVPGGCVAPYNLVGGIYE